MSGTTSWVTPAACPRPARSYSSSLGKIKTDFPHQRNISYWSLQTATASQRSASESKVFCRTDVPRRHCIWTKLGEKIIKRTLCLGKTIKKHIFYLLLRFSSLNMLFLHVSSLYILFLQQSIRGSFKVLRAETVCLSSLPDLCSPNTSDGALTRQNCQFL